MSTAQATRPAKQKPWRGRHAFDPTRPTLAGLIGRYLLLIFVVIISIGPFLLIESFSLIRTISKWCPIGLWYPTGLSYPTT